MWPRIQKGTKQSTGALTFWKKRVTPVAGACAEASAASSSCSGGAGLTAREEADAAARRDWGGLGRSGARGCSLRPWRGAKDLGAAVAGRRWLWPPARGLALEAAEEDGARVRWSGEEISLSIAAARAGVSVWLNGRQIIISFKIKNEIRIEDIFGGLWTGRVGRPCLTVAGLRWAFLAVETNFQFLLCGTGK